MENRKSIKALFSSVIGAVGISATSLIQAAELVEVKSLFNIEEIKWVKEIGNSSVKGKAFLKLSEGQYKGCAGFNIELLPVAKYSSERIHKIYGNNEQGQVLLKDNPPKFTPDPKEYHEMLIKGKCNENSEFSFSQVNSGDYYIVAFIMWDNEVNGKTIKEGGATMKRVRVDDKAVVEAVLKN